MVQGKSDTEVVEAFVKHSHISEKIRIMAQSEEKIDQHQAKRFDVKFHRSVPFAPRGQGSADMNAIIYLIRFPERDNVMYFECNEQQASQYEKQLTLIVRLAKVRG